MERSRTEIEANNMTVATLAGLAYEGDQIPVTRAFLPPMEEYRAWLDRAWDKGWLTNNGPLHRQLESDLRTRLDASHLVVLSNGTLALQLALRALGVKGKVITTPFSYVATVSSILWEGCEPVFADIDPHTFCIDPAAIEAAIDSGTTAIMATHVYGIPCDVEAIERIASRHGLTVIYDGAHAFGVRYKGESLTNYGDACALSFHATKLFHAVEGGALVVHTDEVDERMRLLRSFGHINDDHFCLGINAKMSELHAAMGLSVLPYVEAIIAERAGICAWYDAAIAGTGLERPLIPAGTEYNHAYYPVVFPDEVARDRAMDVMSAQGVIPRRYFHPSLNRLPYVKAEAMPVSERAAATTLCLPLYTGLTEADRERVLLALRASLA